MTRGIRERVERKGDVEYRMQKCMRGRGVKDEGEPDIARGRAARRTGREREETNK